MAGRPVSLDLSAEREAFVVTWVSASGEVEQAIARVRGGRVVRLEPPASGEARPWVAWLRRQADVTGARAGGGVR
jgi:hypothetical protein